jgi:AraC-like DNA-binding protein
MEIGLCHSGEGGLIFEDGETVFFEDGDTTIIPSYVPHTTYSKKDTRSLWSYIFIDIPGLLRDLLPVADINGLLPPKYLFKPQECPRINFLVRCLLEELINKKNDYAKVIKPVVLLLHYEMTRLIADSEPGKNESVNSFVLRPVLEHIQSNYMRPVTIGELADICMLSENHFRRLFLSVMGTPPLTYLNLTRIYRACILLATTKQPVTEIAEAVGMEAVASFNRNFKKIIGVSPSEYRHTDSRININPRYKYVLTYKGWTKAEDRPSHVLEEFE